MPTMQSVQTGEQNKINVVDVERPSPGPNDALVRIRACGICGTDTHFLHLGGVPFGPGGSMISIPLGHEPAGEIVEVGAEVTDLKVGDRVVVNPQDAPSGIIGCGGRLGGMSEYLLIENAVVGKSVAPSSPTPCPSPSPRSTSPWPSRGTASTGPRPSPATRSSSSAPGPSASAPRSGSSCAASSTSSSPTSSPSAWRPPWPSAPTPSSTPPARTSPPRLTELHGQAANALGQPRAGTDIYIDAAGVPAVFNATIDSAKWGAKLVMVAVQKKSDAIDLGGMLRSELTLIASQGYPTEIFEVTPELVEHHERFAKLISHRIPFTEVERAFELALTPGAAEKVVVTFDDRS